MQLGRPLGAFGPQPWQMAYPFHGPEGFADLQMDRGKEKDLYIGPRNVLHEDDALGIQTKLAKVLGGEYAGRPCIIYKDACFKIPRYGRMLQLKEIRLKLYCILSRR